MKHPAIAVIRGLLYTLDRSSEPDMILWTIKAIVEQLKELHKVAVSHGGQNNAPPQSPR